MLMIYNAMLIYWYRHKLQPICFNDESWLLVMSLFLSIHLAYRVARDSSILHTDTESIDSK